MDKEQSLLEFPCDFTIKVIGANNEAYLDEIITIARKYFPKLKDSDIKSNKSKANNYLAISITVHAEDKKTLDALYRKLTKHAHTRMVL